MVKRRRFDRAYKVSAVRMLSASGESVSHVARSLGIHDNLLRRWRKELAESGEGHLTESQRQDRAELERLRRRCRDLEREVSLLKKTMGLTGRARRGVGILFVEESQTEFPGPEEC